MKGILVIIDGMADLPHKLFKDKTPLEAAHTPNMDFFATRGEMGYMYPVKPGFIPESDEAIVSIFGNKLISSSRGWLEAKGANIKLTRGDLAFRVNFATRDNSGNIIDRRAGRTLTTGEAQELARAITNRVKIPCKFIFTSTVQHRAALVFKGGFSENITGNDLTYVMGKTKDAGSCKPLDDTENTQYTANIVNEFLAKAQEILEKHPVNLKRKERGLLPANCLLVRGAGIYPPKLKQYKKWISPSYMPLEIGFSTVSGMKVVKFDYPKLKKLDAYENLWDGLKKACKFNIKSIKKFRKSFDYAYVHIKETDLPGHDNKPLEKKEMLEYIDKTFIKFLRKIAPPNKIKIVITADHSTPCKLKAHSADPVPVLFYNCAETLKEKKFNEKEARKGILGRMEGKELLKKVGFIK
jgi:2,3-bisphosphoglycerate-independent phosphoglycerate mutase